MTAHYPNPHEWLLEKAQHMTGVELFRTVSALAYRLDAESIIDLFGSEMTKDAEEAL